MKSDRDKDFFVEDGVFYIPLKDGLRVRIDEEDAEYLSQFYWQVYPTRTKKSFYAVRNNGYAPDGRRLKVRMHREIMRVTDPKITVDHINRDTTDNRKINLRLCSQLDNCKNQESRGGTSKYRGVHLHKPGVWRAGMTLNYKRIDLGLFDDEELANLACIAARKEHYGEFTND